MIKLETLSPIDHANSLQKSQIADFLFEHLGAYGDPKEDIMKCLDYALDQNSHAGGFVVMAKEDEQLVGVLIMNKTGMSKYIPENILVYIAVDNRHRGKGIGGKIMNLAIEKAEGAIALHVEADNPAKKLYERLGFTNKYLEMRLNK